MNPADPQVPATPQAPVNPAPGKMNQHDWEVILYHCIIAAVQAVLTTLGTENFGKFTPMVAVYIQVASEIVRRYFI